MGCCKSTATADDVAMSEGTAGPEDSKPTSEVMSDETAEQRALTQLKVIFESLDSSGDGEVSRKELTEGIEKNVKIKQLLKDAGMNPNFSDLRNLDKNRDGKISWEEFKESLTQAAVQEVLASKTGDLDAVEVAADIQALKRLKTLFDGLDANEDGTVSKDELLEGMQRDENLGKLIGDAGFNTEYDKLDKLDINKDGKISWQEFEKHLKSAAKAEVKEKGDIQAVVAMEGAQDEAEAETSAWGCC